MGNEDRIRRWRAERDKRPGTAGTGANPVADSPLAARDESADARTDPADRPAGAPALPDELALEEARLAILDRRRARWQALVRRAMLLVAVPLLAILLYMGAVATKLYQGEAIFTVQTSSESAPAPNAGIFGVPSGNSTIADAFKAREFILSRPMMDHMEQRFGFMSHFAAAEMDPLTRFDSPMGLNRDALSYYRKRVRVAVDIQEGILRLYVQARTPQDAVRFGNGILAAAEDHVNRFSDKISEDQISSLTRDVENAERQVAETRRSLAAVQARRGDLSPEQTATAIYQLISNLELQRAEAQRERNALLNQGLSDSPLLPRLGARIQELDAQIAEQRRRLVNPGGTSLQRTLNEYEGAAVRKEIAQARWESTLNLLQQAYLRILEQRRYFVLVVGMSAGSAAAVRDLVSIIFPILLLIALLYAAFYIVAQLNAERGLRNFQFSQVTERWRRR